MNLAKHIFSILGSVFLLLASGCQTDAPVPYQLNIPSWFPEMEIPAENQLTKARIELGRKLFYEPLLSLDSSISCGTCHLQEKAFTQELPISLGVDGALGLRNAPTLANIGFAPYFFHDGGVLTLELQSQQPIFSVDEMRFSIAGFLERIENDAEYKRMFQEAYSREPDAFGITRAIASFERTFISATSRFDQFEYQGITDALSEQEKQGRTLFFSEAANCSSCHEPPLFTNYEFENIGLYLNYADSGRARISHLSNDNGKFKVPTLRNVELTAPYMHNGSLQTLEEVVEHFNSGGVNHPNQSEKIQPLNLNQQEKADLVAFLKTLTDQSFITNTEISNPN
ncbi:MAG: c-type cytochrome [Flavobacteriales bacterium]|nr:c-type cytochrome [Flavobacteriales bacterium]